MTKPLYDEWANPKRPSSAGIPPLNDPEDREDLDRPLRMEDLIPRHGGDGRPKLWLPDGSKMAYYGRPSGWGQDAEEGRMMALWETRQVVSGYLDTGQRGKTLQLERSVMAPIDEDKVGHDLKNKQAKALVFDLDRQGTAKHSMTEKYDLGIPFNVVPEYEYILTEWVRLTKHFKIVDLPTGKPGVECFVAMDKQRLDQYGQPMWGADNGPKMIRQAGTFDRLYEYIPCSICGKRNYVADFKSSGIKSLPFAQRRTGIQEGIYANADLYVPWMDGLGADRFPLPDVCLHRALIISIPPPEDGPGTVKWVDIARGIFRALSLIPLIKDHQEEQDWSIEFTPVPNMWLEIDRAQSVQEVRDLHSTFPGKHWEENAAALTAYASARVAELQAQEVRA